MNEASLVGKLMHPHIMAIYDADVADDYSYIVMECVDGPTLEKYCNIASLLPVDQVVEIAFECSLALEFVHRNGVIQCDIRPANLLVSAHGGSRRFPQIRLSRLSRSRRRRCRKPPTPARSNSTRRFCEYS